MKKFNSVRSHYNYSTKAVIPKSFLYFKNSRVKAGTSREEAEEELYNKNKVSNLSNSFSDKKIQEKLNALGKAIENYKMSMLNNTPDAFITQDEKDKNGKNNAKDNGNTEKEALKKPTIEKRNPLKEEDKEMKKHYVHVLKHDENKLIECELCHLVATEDIYTLHLSQHPSQIFDWLFIGTEDNSLNYEELKTLKINYILNCASEVDDDFLPSSFKYLKLSMGDFKNVDIFDILEEGTEFINNARKMRGNILVHCKFGVSRSTAVVIGYLIKYMGYTADEAIAYVKRKRHVSNPNKGFIKQLREYEVYHRS